MSVNTGTVASNSPQGVGGDRRQKHSQEREPSQLERDNLSTKRQFHDEAVVHLSDDPDVLADRPFTNDSAKTDSPFGETLTTANGFADTANRSNAFENVSFTDISRALFSNRAESPESNGMQGTRSSTGLDGSNNAALHLNGLTDRAAQININNIFSAGLRLNADMPQNTGNPIGTADSFGLGTNRNPVNPVTNTGFLDRGLNGNANGNAGFLDLGSNNNNGNLFGNSRPGEVVLARDNGRNGAQINNLMYYRNEPFKFNINTKTGPLEVQLNPLQSANGEIVRAQNGQPLVQSITTVNKAGVRETLDLKDVNLAAESGVIQQGLILDAEATRMSPGSVVMLRQDGARIPYSVPENSTRVRLTSVSSPEGQRTYFYDNPARPDLATRIVDTYSDQIGTQIPGTTRPNGTQLVQLRERVGTYDVWTLKELDKQTGEIRKEAALNMQVRHDGQLVYQRYLDPQEVQRRINSGEFDGRVDMAGRPVTKQEILDAIQNDTSWLVANDLPSAKRQLLNASKGLLFGGSDSKTENLIDMYITRIRDWRKKGYMTATDDQLALSLRRMTEVFTAQRSGSASKVSNNTIYSHFESMLAGIASPKKYNNQGQIGTCYVNSYRLAAEYIVPHLVIDKWTSIMTTGQAKGRTFTTAELNSKGLAGQNRWNYIMNDLCGKFRYGSKYSLRQNFPGTAEFQALKEYKLLTDGGKLPLGKAARAKFGVQIAYTYGGSHAQTWIGNWLNNTWNGYGEKGKGPADRVETLPC